jgi:hypothetical protein
VRANAWLGLLVAVVIMATACSGGTTRSVAAFCQTFQSEATRFHAKYQAQARASSQTDPLSGLLTATGSLVQAQGDLAVLFDRLEQVAPGEIEPDVAAVRDAFRQQAEALRQAGGDPIGALSAGLVGGLQASGSVDRVQTYLQRHCDLSFQK